MEQDCPKMASEITSVAFTTPLSFRSRLCHRFSSCSSERQRWNAVGRQRVILCASAKSDEIGSFQGDGVGGAKSSSDGMVSAEPVRRVWENNGEADMNVLRDTPVQRRDSHFVDGDAVLTEGIVRENGVINGKAFLRAGPRRKVYFGPDARAVVLTCGGIAPGLNTIVREIVMCLSKDYGVTSVFGCRYGFRGMYSPNGWRRLTPDDVIHIHKDGGTILGSCRGGFDLVKIVDAIETHGISMVFIVGGDGTACGTAKINTECIRRKLNIAICHVPKTVDRDIPLLDNTFGFDTAVEEAQRAINAAAIEAFSFPDCVSIVKLMGRNSGFIAAYSTLASREVDCCLVPEVPFPLYGPKGVLEYIETVLNKKGQFVLVVAEGAGTEHREGAQDIGQHLYNKVKAFFTAKGRQVSMKYLDPTYQVRARPPIASDNIFCTLLAHSSVHAAMAGFTGFCAGPVNNHNVLIPLEYIAGTQAKLNPAGRVWQRVVSSTQQPAWDIEDFDQAHQQQAEGMVVEPKVV